MEPHEIALFLTINFNEEWADLPGGRVKFGLRSGELRLELTQGTIPYSTRNLAGELVLKIEKERRSETSTSIYDEHQTSLGVGLKAEAETQAKIGSTSKRGSSYKQSDKFNVSSCQITTKGELTKPAWVFEVQTEEPVLKGFLSNEKLATMKLSGSEWRIKATFEVATLKDIELTETEGPLLRNASPAKRTALEIGLAKRLLKHKFHPYLSYMELSYE